jgi:hypothetical protein
VTLEETIAEKMAQLLIDAAKAREDAMASEQPRPGATRVVSDASSLETQVMRWEQRLNWWRLLRKTKTNSR